MPIPKPAIVKIDPFKTFYTVGIETAQHILSGEPVKNDPSSGRPPKRCNRCDVSWPNIIF
jgi:hypothetical protein